MGPGQPEAAGSEKVPGPFLMSVYYMDLLAGIVHEHTLQLCGSVAGLNRAPPLPAVVFTELGRLLSVRIGLPVLIP